MMALTVACVWVKGHVGYTADYVTRLRAMVRRHLGRAHHFICLTDQPWALPHDLATMPVSTPTCAGWWAKVQLFAPGRFSGRVVYLDLDSLVMSALDAVVDFPSVFALVPHAGAFMGRNGKAVVPRFNSSVMVWDATGFMDPLCTRWSREVTSRLWGDQDWIGEQMPDAATMPLEWFPRLSDITDGPVPEDAKVVLAKHPKPHLAARRWSWVRDTWTDDAVV